jgi:hypothetical protein
MRLVLAPGADVLASARGGLGTDESLVVVLPPGLAPADAGLARAAIELVAVEGAPAGRVNAVLPAATAALADVEAAIRFLDSATSTTGQLIEVGQPRVRPQGPSASITKR